MSLHVSASGQHDVVLALSAMQRRAGDLSPAFMRFGDAFAEFEERLFATEGASGGEAWAPTSPEYAAWKVRQGYSGMTLQRTGRLKRSLTQRPFDVERVGAREAEFGTSVPYAIYHQRGTKHMPKRPVVQVTSELEDELARLVADWIVEGWEL